MSNHERETDFLKHCLCYDDSVERHQLDEAINRVQRDQRCVWRAVWLMALLTGLAIAGVCYAAVFLGDSPENMTQLITRLTIKVFGALGIGSLICMLAFAALGLVYRKDLDHYRDECRRLATKVLHSRLGNPENVLAAGLSPEQQFVGSQSKDVPALTGPTDSRRH